MFFLLGCLRRLVGLVLLVGLLAAAWHFREQLVPAWRALRRYATDEPTAAEPAPPAVTARAKLARLAAGEADGGSVALSEAEARAVFEPRLARRLPPYVASPRIGFSGGRLRFRVRAATAGLPAMGELARLVAFLPDTAEVAATGQLLPLAGPRAAFAIDEASVSRFPLPDRFIPELLTYLGRTDAPGLPADALVLPLPPGAGAAYVRGDSLVLLPAAR